MMTELLYQQHGEQDGRAGC
uniref:Uncharacterized protein n=1 Tax=Anguilla anguilla TaxID=7936 RepID=A0A0E9VP87_ANGAN